MRKDRCKRPNILFITSDQQHFNTIGKNNSEIKTPNLDRLAEEGMLFDRAYTVNPTCTPTRATLITGKYPSQHGAWTLGTKLPESEHTICQDFQGADYKTALIGKAHFQPLKSTEKYSSLEAYPLLQDMEFWKHYSEKFYGFDYVELARNHTNEAHVGQHYVLWLEEKGCKNWRDYFVPPIGTMSKDENYTWDIPEEYHYDAWIAERTNYMLEQYAKNDENFFLWASFFDPHPRYLVPKPWDTMYDPDKLSISGLDRDELEYASEFLKLTQEDNPDVSKYEKSGFWLHGIHSHTTWDEKTIRKSKAIYYAMTSLMDKYIGKILDKLEELGLKENTLVVFTSDHGNFIGEHGLIAKGPFPFEDMIKVPLIARYPNNIPENRTSSSLQSLVDIVPTFLDYCGIEIWDGVAGLSQKSVWNGEIDNIRNYIVCEDNHERDSICLRTYVDERYKLSVYLGTDHGEIFDLKEDPREVNNLWYLPEYKDLKVELMQKALQAEMKREPKFMPRIAGA